MISVVIPVYNEEKRILSTLKAIYQNTVLPDEVIVADGRSTDSTVRLIRENYSQVIVVDNPERKAASGRNVGIRIARGNIIAFTDGDCMVDSTWIEAIRDVFETYDPDGIGGKVIPAEAENRIEAYWGNLAWNLIMSFDDTPYQVEACTINDSFVTANCAYKKSLLEQLGGFSQWFGNNAEDTDLCWRAVKTGAKLRYSPEAVIYARNVTTVSGVIKKSFRNGFSSSKLQKKHGKFINFDPNIYNMLGKNLAGLLCRRENAGLNTLELFSHLMGKYYGSVRVGVINV